MKACLATFSGTQLIRLGTNQHVQWKLWDVLVFTRKSPRRRTPLAIESISRIRFRPAQTARSRLGRVLEPHGRTPFLSVAPMAH